MNFVQEIISLPKLIISSAREFKSTKAICGVAMLTALNVVAGTLLNIQVTPMLRIGFSSVFAAISAMLYGPLLSGSAGIVADTLKYLIRPDGPYFPGFALNEFLTAFIYGSFFYKKNVSLPRSIIARFFITVIINLTLTSLWLNILYDNPIFTSLRLFKNVIAFPFDCAILYFALQAAQRVVKRIKR